jgi:hypothetical protein
MVKSVGVKPGWHVRPSPVRLQSGLKLDALLCVAKCQSGNLRRYLVLATRCDAIPVLSEFVGDPPRD